MKVFEKAEISGLNEFVTAVAETSDKLSQLVQKNISLSDNIDQSSASYLMPHGKSIFIDAPQQRKKVRAIIPYQTDFDRPITSFSWRYTQSGKLELRAWFMSNPQLPQNVSMSIFY